MAGIKEPIQDILTKLSAIQVVDMDRQTNNLYSRIWNNQLLDMKEGSGYVFQRPAAFLEIMNPCTYEVIGLGFRSADLGVRIHLIHDFVNQDGTFEQDLQIFELRDTLIDALSGYCPTACSPLNCIREEQEYSHDNLYHYVLDFVCNFTDSKGSDYDPAKGKIIEEIIPNLDLEVNKVDSNPVSTEEQEFIIP